MIVNMTLSIVECTDDKVEGLKLEEDDTTGKAVDKDPKQYPQESSA